MFTPQFRLVLCMDDGSVHPVGEPFETPEEAQDAGMNARVAVVKCLVVPVLLAYVIPVEGAEHVPPVADMESGTLCGHAWPEEGQRLHPDQHVMHPGHAQWLLGAMEAAWGGQQEEVMAEPGPEPESASVLVQHACGHEVVYGAPYRGEASQLCPTCVQLHHHRLSF